MKPAWVRQEEARDRLDAARAWQRHGLLDEGGQVAVRGAHRGTREPLGWIWQLLVFFFTLASLGGTLGTVFVIFSDADNSQTGAGLIFVLFAAGSLLLAELISAKDGPGLIGADAACSSMAVLCAAIGLGLLLDGAGADIDLALKLMPTAVSLLLGAAAWRYGYPLYAAGAAASAFLQLTVLDDGRLLWILLGSAAAAGAWRWRDAPASRSHRDGLWGVLAVSLAAVYVAVNLWSVDAVSFGDFLDLRHTPSAATGMPWRWAAAPATAAIPLLVLAWGIRARSRLLIALGVLFGTASLVTLRFYVHLAPLEFVLILSGGALVTATLLLMRWLGSGPGAERGGFTAEPLFGDERLEKLMAVAAVATTTPDARRLPDQDSFRGQGGDFGGGGASSSF